MEEFVRSAKSKNVDEITFTDHFDIYDGLNTKFYTMDVDLYYQNYLKFKAATDFPINFGIEVGLQPHLTERILNMLGSYPFDFVIASQHVTRKTDIGQDPSFFSGRTRNESYMVYFEEMLENINLYDNFDVFGHLDYVVRYGGFDKKYIEYKEFAEILDEILISLIKRDKGIELNTSGLRYGLPFPHPNTQILKRYKELGGKIITMGSDAHNANDIASDFNKAKELLKTVGFKEIAVFRKRKPYFYKIDLL
jgi:histidinol-phosphatase (PHP family)